METDVAAQRWRNTWEAAWPRHDHEAIVKLYAPECLYRALVFREPERGVEGVRAYLLREFGVEKDVMCRFGEPVCGDGRAAVQWWASWSESGRELTMAGVTMLHFNDDGMVVDHRDYWNETPGRAEPFAGW